MPRATPKPEKAASVEKPAPKPEKAPKPDPVKRGLEVLGALGPESSHADVARASLAADLASCEVSSECRQAVSAVLKQVAGVRGGGRGPLDRKLELLAQVPALLKTKGSK